MRYITLLFLLLVCDTYIIGQSTVIDSLESSLHQATSNVQKGKIAIYLAKAYQRIDLEKTKEYANQALDLFEEYDTLQVDAYDQLGRYYFFSSKLDSARIHFTNAKEVLAANNLHSRVASINISIGSVLLRNGQFKEASAAFISSAEYFEANNDDANAAKCYTNLAAAFAELKDYPSAIDYSLKALEIVRKIGMVEVESVILPNLATQYIRNNDKTNALKYYKEAEQLSIKHNNKRSLALVYNNLGDLYLSDQDYITAETYINKAVQLKKDMNQLKGLEESYFNLGLIQYKKKNYKSALGYYKSIEDQVLGLDKVQVLRSFKDLYRDMGNPELALDYGDQAQILADSLKQEESKQIISELATKYETAQKENEILMLQYDNQQLEIQKSRNRMIAFGLGGLLLLTSLIAYFMLKNIRRKRLIREQQFEIKQSKLQEALVKQEMSSVEKLITGQEEERMRIARDLHDSLGSKLSTLKRFIEGASESLTESSEPLSSALTLADESYIEVRNIAHNINAGMLADKGLIPALREMKDVVAVANNIQIQLSNTGLNFRLPNHVEIQLFRIIQEIITNVIKHAQANEIIIQLTNHDDHLNVMVEDNGRGFDASGSSSGIGLMNIKKRIEQLKGSFDIDSSPSAGTTVILNVPL